MEFDLVVMQLAPLEMLFVNLFAIHKCSQRKYSRSRTYLTLGLFSCALLSATYPIVVNLPDFGRGNGLFVFFGILFIVPIKLLYRGSVVKIATIACYSWTYTFLLFALSIRINYLLNIPEKKFALTALMTQTILYIITFRKFYIILRTRFVYILEHIGKSESVALMWMTMMWFWMVFIANLSFAYPNLRLFQVLSLLTLVLCVLSSFRYIYLQINCGETIQKLEEIAYNDNLTQLRSRMVLNSDAQDLISRKIPFYLIFFDLNDFKSINDLYGHLAGDRYLAFFAHEIKTRTGNRGGFYRIGGDEFVCLLLEDNLATYLKEITTLPRTVPNLQIKFLGFSFGVATYPKDGDSVELLLQCADQRMYRMKRSVKGVADTTTTPPELV